MKRAVMTFFLVSALAGVASAQMMRPAAEPNPVRAAPASTPARSPVMAKVETPASRADSSQAPVSTLVARQAPVPMLVRSRATFVPPADLPEAAPETAVLRGRTEGDARSAIEADGYKRVRVVSKAADGTWQARAFRGATEVSLRVDAQGNVVGE